MNPHENYSPRLNQRQDAGDLSELPVLKEAKDPLKNSVSADELAAIQQGKIDPSILQKPQPPPPVQIGVAQPQPGPDAVSYPGQPPQYGPNVAAPAVPTDAPPVVEGDSERAAKRINRLFGQREQFREERDAYASELQSLRNELAALRQSQQAPIPQSNTFGSGDVSPGPAAGPYVSRQDLLEALAAQTQALGSYLQNREAQSASRTEAEQHFPQVFQDPTLRSQVETIVRNDKYLSQDPDAFFRAAAMVAGAAGPQAGSGSGDLRPPPDVRRAAISPVGSSVPSGNQAPQEDLVAAYEQAKARALATQSLDDFAKARIIHRQLLAAQGIHQ